MRNLMMTLSMAAALTLASGLAQAGEKIRIGSEGAYSPFNMINEKGELTGFDIDIAMALCAEMKVECELVAQDWDGIIPGLLSRKYDAIVASMSITEERKRVVDFTDHYYSNVLAYIAPKGKTIEATKDGLKGLTVGAQRATLAGQYLEDNLGDVVTVKLYDTQDNAYLDLAAGRLDVLLSDKFPAYDWLTTDAGKGFEFKGKDIDTNDQIGIAIRKNDPLKERFNKALQAIVDNGTYQKINAKYFPFSIY